MTIQVWYHGHCDDGFGAAYAAWKFFSKFRPNEKVDYKPVYYGKNTPAYEKDDVIYIVDFSYKRNILVLLKTQVKSLTILDHHKSAAEDLKDFPDSLFDMNRSGAVITWNWFHKEPVPLLLRYVQANDLWKHKSMPDTQAICRYIRSQDYAFEAWDKMALDFETNFDKVRAKAQAVEAYFQNQLAFNLAYGKVIEFEGHRCAIINCNKTFVSEISHMLMEKYQCPIAIGYVVKPDNTVEFSMRGEDKSDVDVSAICKKYGGGGHAKAAGFLAQLSVLHTILTQVE